ncbi:hypothetical protein [Mesorhizobium sophorae]|uniref:hypothetical protein n=1 Tax=Mesorhizobium sophorae TaxID=1300294 RepID=UPI00197DE2AE|nr:hypothetical protein [Mesorhizobium sophorae]
MILLPRGLAIVVEACVHVSEWAFDDVKAFFVLTLVLMLLLAVVAVTQCVGLIAKWYAIGPVPKHS